MAKKQDTHVFTTDNPLMVDMGLGSFTTGTLYEWVTTNNFNNARQISGWVEFDQPDQHGNSAKDATAYSIMNAIVGDVDSFLYAINVDGPEAPYRYEIDTYRPSQRNSEDFTYEFLYSNDASPFTPSAWDYNVEDKSYTLEDVNIEAFSLANGVPGYENFSSSRFIRLNEIILTNDEDGLALTTEDAAKQFIRDIKSSYEGGIKWTQYVNIVVPGSTVDCEIRVDWKLALRGKAPKKNHQLALNGAPVIVDDMKTPDGRIHAGVDRTDGNRRIPKTGDEPQTKRAGKLATHYNEYTGEYESGTTSIVAIMKTDLLPAVVPDKGSLANPDEYKDKDTGLQVTHGTAVPLSMKNGNPYQWGPEWKYTTGCSGDEREEVLDIPVQNKLPTGFSRGDTVILNKIDGVWQPNGQGSGIEIPELIAPAVDSWSFSSYMTNAEHYFFNTPNRRRIFPEDYEQAIYNKYYGITNPPELAEQLGNERNGFVQVTSFDMMGANVGGTRTNNALGNTNVKVRNNGEPYDRAINELLPETTTPFFGALFPDGYQPGAKYSRYTNPDGLTTNMAVTGPLMSNDEPAFQSPISAGAVPFEDASENIDGSIFAAGDSRLRHLPADIALNAHPQSTNGSPIENKDAIYFMLEAPTNPVEMRDNIKSIMGSPNLRYSWLHTEGAPTDSTFDFTPVNNTVVQFRPLKAEVYGIYERIYGSPNTTDKAIRGCYATEVYNKVNGSVDPPLSIRVLQRGDFLDSRGILGIHGFKQGHDINSSNYPGTYGIGNAFPQPYMQGSWVIGDGALASIGVIAATCTITANASVVFNTQNLFGMDDFFDPGGIFGSQWNSSYGGRDSSYYSLLNTTMHARIYQHHPRELTIYDPTHFAIFHFASGIGEDLRARYVLSDGSIATCTDADGVTVDCDDLTSIRSDHTNWLNDNAPEGYDPDGKLGTKWAYEVADYDNVDFKQPTLNDDSDPFGVIAPPGTRVFKDGIDGQSPPNQPGLTFPLWRDIEHWRVQADARGALLPVALNRNTIGVEIIRIEDDGGGELYGPSDTFTVEGSDTGTGVVLTPRLDQGGIITGFDIANSGQNFQPKDFFTDETITIDNTSYSSAQLKVVPLNVVSEGVGLQAYVMTGMVWEVIGEVIDKPLQATNAAIIDLTPKPPLPHEAGAPRRDLMSESREQNVVIVNKSSDDKYDIFLHYHNDCSHVFHRAWLQGNPPIEEQFVELTISPG